ncbi:MAG: putative polymerase delta subunit [Planctomycetota bacterium]|jgi:DNA polymerase-3 subunit delta'
MAKRATTPAGSKAPARAPRSRAGEQQPEERARPVHHDGPVLFGQELATTQLAQAIGSGHMHHAWILHGPSGVGKCTAAMECARLLLDDETLDENIAAFKAPRDSRVAELIDLASHPDLHVIRKERADDSSIKEMRDRKQTNIPLDLLRELMIGGVVGDGKSFDSPVWRGAYLGHNKVFIIDEAELLDPYGQNALLKTLEEPPAGTYVFLVTTQEERLLPTIRSRCQRVAFRALDAAAMGAWFDRFGVEDSSRPWLSEFSEGAPGTAELAMKHGLRAWSEELLPRFAMLEQGRFDGGLADRLAELVGEFAERVVKENTKASKEAANRQATRCALLTLASRSRAQIAAAAMRGDVQGVAEAAYRVELIVRLESEVRANVNLKHALANLVAQWGAV